MEKERNGEREKERNGEREKEIEGSVCDRRFVETQFLVSSWGIVYHWNGS